MNYMARQIKGFQGLFELGVLPPKAGNMTHACIRHDDDCPILKDIPDCTCLPEMVLVVPDGRQFEVDLEGGVKPRSTVPRCLHV